MQINCKNKLITKDPDRINKKRKDESDEASKQYQTSMFGKQS